MASENIIVLKPATKEFPKDKIGELIHVKPEEMEAGGRAEMVYYQCPRCQSVLRMPSDQAQATSGALVAYNCPNCGTVGVC